MRIKWAGQCETHGRCSSSCRAAVIITKSMVGHPLESLPVPSLLNTMSTCIIILQTGGSVWAFRRIVLLATQILWRHVTHAPTAPPPLVPPPTVENTFLCASLVCVALSRVVISVRKPYYSVIFTLRLSIANHMAAYMQQEQLACHE